MRVVSLAFVATAAAAALLLQPVAAANYGFATGVSKAGLDSFKNAVLPELNAALAQFATIPDIKEHVKTPIGHVDLTLSNIRASGLHIDNANLVMTAPGTVGGSIAGLHNAKISMDYHVRRSHWPHTKLHGSIDITPGTTTAGVTIAISASGGKPHASCSGVNVSFDKFKIKFHGSLSWLLNIVTGLLKGTLRKSIEKAVQGKVQTAVNAATAKVFAKLPSHMHLGNGLSGTDYSLATDVLGVQGAGSAATAVLAFDLAATDALRHAKCPIATLPMPPIVAPEHYMLQAQLSPATLSCALWTAYTNGALDSFYTPANKPRLFPLPLNTSKWADLGLPQLPAKYPNRAMSLNVTFDKSTTPSITASKASGLQAHLPVALDFGVLAGASGSLRGVSSYGGSLPVFTLGADMVAGLSVSLSMQHSNATGQVAPVLKFHVTALDLNLKVLRSSIGELSVGFIQTLVDLVLPTAKSLLNGLGGLGFPLPSLGGMAFQNPAIVINEHVLAVNTNITISF